MADVATRLRERAETYGTDAAMLRQEHETDLAVIYETIRDELRKVADEVEAAP